MSKVKLQDVQRAAKLAKDILPMLQPVLEQYAPELINLTQEKAKDAVEKGKRAKLEFLSSRQKKKEAKEQEIAAAELRKRAVTSSMAPMTAEGFYKSFESSVADTSKLDSGFMGITGCYAIITMKSSREKDLSAYKDVYVGYSKSIGLAVYSQLRGLGNIDVYADYKFKQPMWILCYPCNEAEIGPHFAELLRSLQAADSYNKRDLESLAEED